MHIKQIEIITKKVGSTDAPGLIKTLESFGVGEDVEITEDEISIPKSVVKNSATLQSELSSLSKVGRLYQLSEKDGRILINVVKYKPQKSRSEFERSL